MANGVPGEIKVNIYGKKRKDNGLFRKIKTVFRK